MALSSVYPRLSPSTQTFIYLFRWWQHQRAARLSIKHHRGESQGHMSIKRRSTGRVGGFVSKCSYTHTGLCVCVCVWMCVKLLYGQVRETWCKFTQSPLSFAFKAWGSAEYTTAGGTVKEQNSKWLSFPQLTYVWPWQANPNIEKRTYVKTICRRRKAGCGGRASLHLVTDTAVWRETSANMFIHKACRRMARPALFSSLLCQRGRCIYVCVCTCVPARLCVCTHRSSLSSCDMCPSRLPLGITR